MKQITTCQSHFENAKRRNVGNEAERDSGNISSGKRQPRRGISQEEGGDEEREKKERVNKAYLVKRSNRQSVVTSGKRKLIKQQDKQIGFTEICMEILRIERKFS